MRIEYISPEMHHKCKQIYVAISFRFCNFQYFSLFNFPSNCSFQVFNSEMASTQKDLEALRERNLKLEQIYTAKSFSFRQQVANKIALSNCFEICHAYTSFISAVMLWKGRTTSGPNKMSSCQQNIGAVVLSCHNYERKNRIKHREYF